MTKRCFKCKRVKGIEQFYKHPSMADGRLNKCKTCAKKDVKDPKYRERIVAYEKARWQTPERREAAKLYQRSMRLKSPGKYKARTAVNNALRDGRIVKTPCLTCGSRKVQAHHSDYRSPLKVKWYCRKHHMQIENKVSY